VNQDPNVAIVELVVAALGPLADELVLVGGCAVGLLITDRARPPVRQTVDVDLLTEVAPTANYYAFCERLRAQGFREQPTEEVICRWAKGHLLIDVMPTDGTVIGFTNSWYAEAVTSAKFQALPNGQAIRLLSAPLFIATKLEAFRSRGAGDYLHHDMEDIVNLVDGRDTIVDEVTTASQDAQDFLADEFDALLSDPTFVEHMSWHLAPYEQQARKDIVLERMRRIAGI
jgi:predicted nucleotidyltransferase